MNGLINPNATAVAMAPGARAGSAAALLGLIQFDTGAVSAAIVGALDDGTAWPMAAVISGIGGRALIAARFAPRPASRPTTVDSGRR